ncbi:MAG: hypothetical protein K5622_06345 [Endomicrobiaceae bacterium]|nr:hypothetical protein [Endomicrobiaceae bacterium]
MKIKNFVLTLSLIIFASLPVHADVVWPSLYIAKGMLSIKVILLGLFVELLFVKYFTKADWKKASIVTFLMNLITTLIGIMFIPLSGLGSEFVFDFIFHAYDKFGIGTFHWSHWLTSYLLVIFINTFMEGLFIKLTLKIKLTKTFWWLLTANSISVFICFLFYVMSL